jgi:hypothetical protein
MRLGNGTVPGLSPAVTSSAAAVSTSTPSQPKQPRCDLGDELGEQRVQTFLLLVERHHAPAEHRERGLGCEGDRIGSRSRPQRGCRGSEMKARHAAEAFRRSSDPVKPRWRIWLSVVIFVERVLRLATTNALIASTLPSRVLPAPCARPDNAVRAASAVRRSVRRRRGFETTTWRWP